MALDPYSAAITGAVGIGLELYGMNQYNNASSQYNAAQMGVYKTQLKENEQRRQFMELDNRRKKLENLRNTQRARQLALSNASNQGAQGGSGLAGGYGQVMGMGEFNEAGLSQSKEIGENLFNLTNQESAYKLQASQSQMAMSKAQGMSSFGGSILGSATSIGSII